MVGLYLILSFFSTDTLKKKKKNKCVWSQKNLSPFNDPGLMQKEASEAAVAIKQWLLL